MQTAGQKQRQQAAAAGACRLIPQVKSKDSFVGPEGRDNARHVRRQTGRALRPRLQRNSPGGLHPPRVVHTGDGLLLHACCCGAGSTACLLSALANGLPTAWAAKERGGTEQHRTVAGRVVPSCGRGSQQLSNNTSTGRMPCASEMARNASTRAENACPSLERESLAAASRSTAAGVVREAGTQPDAPEKNIGWYKRCGNEKAPGSLVPKGGHGERRASY